jgi:hypothetical protein
MTKIANPYYTTHNVIQATPAHPQRASGPLDATTNLPALEIPTSIPVTPICLRIAHIGPDADFLHLDGETPVATAPPKTALGAALLENESDGSPVLSLLSFSTSRRLRLRLYPPIVHIGHQPVGARPVTDRSAVSGRNPPYSPRTVPSTQALQTDPYRKRSARRRMQP